MKRNVFVCGSDGQLGSDCVDLLSGNWHVRATDINGMDITDRDAVFAAMREVRPDFIVNCAAYTRVDQCETDRESAWRVNALGPRILAEAAARTGATLVHVSTDYVFDGRREPPQPYTEKDEPRPLSVYGRTKLEGEEGIRSTTDRHMILRTAWLYGLRGQNFLKTMLRLTVASPERTVRVVDDQFGCPTWSADLARQILRLMEAGGRGTYHVTGGGFCTWYGLASYFLDRMGVTHHLVPCSTSDYPTPARRPRNSILENRRLREEGVYVMRPWREAIDDFVSAHQEGLMKEANG